VAGVEVVVDHKVRSGEVADFLRTRPGFPLSPPGARGKKPGGETPSKDGGPKEGK
jgi:hypothetical protein